MNLYYLDSSIFITYLISEKGFLYKTNSMKNICASKLTEVEVYRFLDRELNSKRINVYHLLDLMRVTRFFFDQIQMIPVSDDILEAAKSSFAHSVKTLDAIHASTVQWLSKVSNRGVVFCSLNEKLNQVVMRLGIETQNSID